MKFEEWYKTVDGHLSPHTRMIALAGWNAAVEAAATVAQTYLTDYLEGDTNDRRANVARNIREAIRQELK